MVDKMILCCYLDSVLLCSIADFKKNSVCFTERLIFGVFVRVFMIDIMPNCCRLKYAYMYYPSSLALD